MYKFGKQSRASLETLDDRLKTLVTKAIKVFDFKLIYGYRSHEKQQELFDRGLSKKKPGASKHNIRPAEAFDAVPCPIDWNDIGRFKLMAGILKGIASEMGIKIRWGGDWDGDNDMKDQSFFDYGHFEIIQ